MDWIIFSNKINLVNILTIDQIWKMIKRKKIIIKDYKKSKRKLMKQNLKTRKVQQQIIRMIKWTKKKPFNKLKKMILLKK